MKAFTSWFTAKRRKYIYRVTTAGLVLASGYGLITSEQVSSWVAFLTVALVTGMADANTDPTANTEA